MDQFDLFAGKAAKADGIASVKDHNVTWIDQGLAVIGALPVGWVGIGEDLRRIVVTRIGKPNHPNAWGALVNTSLKRGWFTPTGHWLSPADVKSHSRPTRQYRKVT